jgi:hypothetical protein
VVSGIANRSHPIVFRGWRVTIAHATARNKEPVPRVATRAKTTSAGRADAPVYSFDRPIVRARRRRAPTRTTKAATSAIATRRATIRS